MSDELLDFYTYNRPIFNAIKKALAFSEETFSIILIDGKKYIRTRDEDIEYTPENLKKYLDNIIIQAADDPRVVTPSLEEYYSLYNCGDKETDDYKYIIESEPYISDSKIENENFNEEMTDEEKITSIVQKERRVLNKNNNLKTASLAGECEDSTLRVLIDSISKGCEEATYLFPPNYLNKGSTGHNCSIVNLNGKSYLIDCTYRQFFEKKNCNRCGTFMINDQFRRSVAKHILKQGWIEATPENLKAYMDGFEMGQRNSLNEPYKDIPPEEYIRRMKTHKKTPINIITSKEIVELGRNRKLNSNKLEEAALLIEGLENEKYKIKDN